MTTAGPELDLEVARRVFRLVVLMDGSGPRLFYPRRKAWEPIPPYSTDTTWAHKVRQTYRVKGWRFHVNSVVTSDASQTWAAQIEHPTDPVVFTGTGSTLPEAICRAAISAAHLL